ncbi:MFS transporter [Burkholderia savannae]|uniref:MFS transporter n=1 Tax=Burkholderia savannae TaxID=1637837 RepID=UPI0009E928F9|nr:MFS transporter [Burkholderia savannae]
MNTKARHTSKAFDSRTADAASHGVFGWRMHTSSSERRAFWNRKIANILDTIDMSHSGFSIPLPVASWNVCDDEAGLMGTVTPPTPAFDGWVTRILSYRIGRVKTQQTTIPGLAVSTLARTLAQNYRHLLIARGSKGFSFGEKWAGGAAMIGEVVRPHDHGKAVGMAQACWTIGWAASAGLDMLAFTHRPSEFARRSLFASSTLSPPLVIVIRPFVDEPESHKQRQQRELEVGPLSSLLEIFGTGIWLMTLRTAIFSTGMPSGFHAIMTRPPTNLKTEQHLNVVDSSGNLAALIAGSHTGYSCDAFLRERVGRKLHFNVLSIASMAIALIHTRAPTSSAALLVGGFLLRFFASGILAGFGTFMTEIFRTRWRRTGQGFHYNSFSAADATFQLLRTPDRYRCAKNFAAHRDQHTGRDRIWCRHSGSVDAAGNVRRTTQFSRTLSRVRNWTRRRPRPIPCSSARVRLA